MISVVGVPPGGCGVEGSRGLLTDSFGCAELDCVGVWWVMSYFWVILPAENPANAIENECVPRSCDISVYFR